MQAIHNHKNTFKASLEQQPVSVYMGRRIFLSRIVQQGTDKGLWLHWCHPHDEGKKGALKYGQFIAPDQTLEDALHVVYQLIEASIELEMLGDARYNFQAVTAQRSPRESDTYKPDRQLDAHPASGYRGRSANRCQALSAAHA